MEEKIVDFIYDYEDEKSLEETEYEEKIKAIQKAYDDLEEYKKKEFKKQEFKQKILEWKEGVYYILFEKKVFYQSPLFDEDDEIVDYRYIRSLEYILYDGNCVLNLSIDDNEYRINRIAYCILPQVNKQLEHYNITLRPENVEHTYGINDGSSIKINQKLSGW